MEYFSLQAQIVTLRGSADGSKQYRHNQQLEELRNLQDKLSAEKAAFAAARDQEAKELEEKRQELLRLQVKLDFINLLSIKNFINILLGTNTCGTGRYYPTA